MLRSTFLHIAGIGSKKEAELWHSGVRFWQDFGQSGIQLSLFNDKESRNQASLIEASMTAFEEEDANYFARRLPRREHYRVATGFLAKTLFLDIETTGLSKYYDKVTVVGWSMNGSYDVYIEGTNLKPLRDALKEAKAIVTFNGSSFDLPFLNYHYEDLTFPQTHVDLRFLAKQLGISGGQKNIETLLGIRRGGQLEGLTGESAPLLWHKYKRGDLDALRLLVSYNQADVEGMRLLFKILVTRLAEKNGFPVDCLSKSLEFENISLEHIQGATLPERIVKELKPYEGDIGPFLTIDELFFKGGNSRNRIVGIDLTGSENRASGWCFLDGRNAVTRQISTDTDLIEATLSCQPDLVSIDSPLSLPKGRISVSDSDPGRKEYGIMRECERILKRRGINVYPSLIQSMQSLTARGMRLAEALKLRGIPVIESYPGAAQDIMGIPRKQKGKDLLRDGLREFGVEGEFINQEVSHDELDAITSAVVGLFYQQGQYEALGNEAESYLIVPRIGEERWSNTKDKR